MSGAFTTALRLGVITDLHLAAPGEPPYSFHGPHRFHDSFERYEAALALLDADEPDAIVVLGDITHRSGRGVYERFVEISGTARTPVLAIGGNHDAELDARRAPGEQAVPVIRVDSSSSVPLADRGLNVVRTERSTAPDDPLLRAIGAGTFRGELAGPVEGPTVLLSHFPVLSMREAVETRGLTYAGDLVDRGRLEAELHASGVPVVVLHGHLHVRAFRHHARVAQLSFGAHIERPFDAACVDIELGSTEGRVRVRQRGPDGEAAAALAPRALELELHDGGWRAR